MSSKAKAKSKSKVKKKKKVYFDDDTHQDTLASAHILSDHERSQQKAMEALPVGDPDSEHFDETKLDKAEYFTQTIDWIDYDTSTALQEKYSVNLPPEYERHNIDVAPMEPQQIDTTYSENAYRHIQSALPDIEGLNYGSSINTDRETPSFETDVIANPMLSRNDKDKDKESGNDEWEEEELTDQHPSEGGDPRRFIQNQIKEHSANFQHWKKYEETEQNELPEYRSPLADRYEDKNNWWNYSSKKKYDMPHQALHGGVDNFDDESDVPLNAYWHKATVSPDSWHMIKTKFRQNMRPGSEEWNRWAFRGDFERKALKYWPEAAKIWFVRSEEELVNCHDFRCKMLEHSAMDEYWRLGELRWNRKLWEPYTRIGTWVIAPIFAFVMTWWYRRAVGKRSRSQFDDEFSRWKQTAAKDQGDEHYMLAWRDTLQKRRPPPVVSPAMSVEEHESRRGRTISYHAERLMRGKPGDPY
mmetsp:Transcript_55976/g.89099  ORF Transcript_55976/g.89099 Transcript_55976/m.89099 type:complete len:471 (+) Transcript_55976:12-1424(+)